jgi:hypothetical protein
MAGPQASEATPVFERLWPTMTRNAVRAPGNDRYVAFLRAKVPLMLSNSSIFAPFFCMM